MCADRRRSPTLPALVLGALAAGLATGVVAQVMPAGDDDRAVLRPERAFGEPLSWLNALPATRLPRREEPLERTALTAPAPPPRRGVGAPVFRATIGAEFRDNLFLTADDPQADTVLTVSPGVSWTALGRNWTLVADGVLEGAQFLENPDASRAVNGYAATVGGSWSFSPRLSVDGFNSFVETRETGDALLPGQLPPFTRSRTNALSATLRARPDERIDLSAGYRNTIQTTDAPGIDDIVEHAGEAEASYVLSRRTRLDARGRIAAIDFEGGGTNWVQGARARVRHELGERLVLSAHGGMLATDADGGRIFPDLAASASVSWRNVVVAAEAGRSIIATVGADSPLLMTEATLTVGTRLAPGLLLDGRIDRQWFTVLDGTDDEIVSTSAEARLSYALGDAAWAFVRWRFSREDASGTVIDSNRVLLGLMREF